MTVIQFPGRADLARRLPDHGELVRAIRSKYAERRASLQMAGPTPDDPVFRAIERFLLADFQFSILATSEPSLRDRAAHTAWKKQIRPLADACDAATHALFNTVPKTRIGARTLIKFILENGDPDDDDLVALLETIASAMIDLH